LPRIKVGFVLFVKRPAPLTILAFLLLLTAAFALGKCKNAPAVANSDVDPICEESHDHNHAREHPDLGWTAGNNVLLWASHFGPAMQIDTLPQWNECGVDYYVELAKRREAAIAYSQEHRPKILWMGNDHSTPKLRRAPEVRTEWIRQHDDAAKMVINNLTVKVFSFEALGTDDVLDRNGMMKRLEEMNSVGFDESDKEYSIEYILKNGAEAQYPILRHRPDIAIITGEECPYRLHAYILYTYLGGAESDSPIIHIDADDCVGKIHYEMSERLVTLRTEVTIIRVIERMQKEGVNIGAILQGNHHAKDLDDLAEAYGFATSIYDLDLKTYRTID
jgi:hypothetical protein